MIAVVGVFKSRSDAERGAGELAFGNCKGQNQYSYAILTPEVTDKEIAGVPAMGGEQPGMGRAMGAVVGGTMGVASGAGLAPAIASLVVPGVGPVLGIGILAGTVLGAIGAVVAEPCARRWKVKHQKDCRKMSCSFTRIYERAAPLLCSYGGRRGCKRCARGFSSRWRRNR
jgi:uncharacterized membrane protein YeaQ/YmgE (transglycosylase-associated protein family)